MKCRMKLDSATHSYFILLSVASVLVILALATFGQSIDTSRWHVPKPAVNFTNATSTSNTTSPPVTPSIPRILHQTWDTEKVPRAFRAWISSWRKLHPEWEYWFWTEADVRRLLRAHYPRYLSLYDGYRASIFRADVMRYFVLYHYGGVYADLDVEALRPLDTLLNTSGCILSYETYEHAYFLYHQTTPVVMTTIMASRPKHPFFKMVQESLHATSKKKNVLDATGPFLLNTVYLKYIRSNTSKTPSNSITVLDPKYLLPTFDNGILGRMRRECLFVHSGALARLKKRLCKLHKAENWKNHVHSESYTNHHWFHVMAKGSRFKNTDTFHIDSLAPNRTNLHTLF